MSEAPEEGGGGAEGALTGLRPRSGGEDRALSSLRTRVAGGSKATLTRIDQGVSGQDESITNSELEDNVELVKKRVRERLDQDILACDVQLSLFVAACTSYRHDTTLRPFPPMFLNRDTGEREVERLLQCVRQLPSLRTGLDTLPSEAIRLVEWVLRGGPAQLGLRSLDKEETEALLGRLGLGGCAQPSHVLAVSTSGTERWCKEAEENDTCLAFHGSRLDNFFSILNYGLQQHRNKVSLFGEGIYLSEDLGVCLAYSSRGVGWERSRLGSCLSCVAVAQVVSDNPSVKRTTQRVEGSEGGSVPEKYIVVRNNELLHIRYLMVYQHKTGGSNFRNSRIVNFLANNKMALLLLAYAVMLALIGLSNSQWFRRWLWKNGYIDL